MNHCASEETRIRTPPLAPAGISTGITGITQSGQEMSASKVTTQRCSSIFSPAGSSTNVLTPEVSGQAGRIRLHIHLWS